MAFRFQKRIKIAPGLRLNISKTGVSTSIGTNGATVNLGKDGAQSTVGIPGTGLSYRSKLTSGKTTTAPAASPAKSRRWLAVIGFAIIAGLAVWASTRP